MHRIVKITENDDGDKVDDPKWCLVRVTMGDPATLCTAQYFGFGQSGCKFREKRVKRGGITCPRCLEIIRDLKALRL